MIRLPSNRITKENYNHISTERDKCSITWLFITLPILFFVLSILCTFDPTRRSSNIEEYNKRVFQWNDHIYPELIDSSFIVNVNNQNSYFVSSSYEYGEFWPVRDTCKLWRDPNEGCIESQDLFFTSTISLFDQMSLHFKYMSFDIGDINIHGFQNYTLYPDGLICESLYECYVKCLNLNGTWNEDTASCSIVKSLSEMCYTIYKIDTIYLLSPNLNGCIYSENEWKATKYVYGVQKNAKIYLRYIEDPYLSAAELTDDCSVNTDTNNACFGQYAQYSLGLTIFFMILCLLTIVIEISLVCLFSQFYPNTNYVPLFPCCHKQCTVIRCCC